jgi:imidazoleglycerol-phosphate dehydratase / histidinol-phosphatase
VAVSATLFIERDGALITAAANVAPGKLAGVRFLPGVFAALGEARRRGMRLVLLGTAAEGADAGALQEFVLEAFASQGIGFDALLLCPHGGGACACRDAQAGLLGEYLREHPGEAGTGALIVPADRPPGAALPGGLRVLAVRREGAPHESWPAVLAELSARRASVVRATRETRVAARVDLDAAAPLAIATGIGFFDHMLEQLASHGGFALELECRGDLEIDEHHTVEDCALTLGESLRRALANRAGIARYGFLLPMDEAEAQVALDLCGRAYFSFEGRFARESVGALPTELVPHFFRSLADALGAALHLRVAGENTHHMVEACFKGVGRALRQALARSGSAVPSTKGVLG